jgi:transposase
MRSIKKYTEEFKREALRLCETSDKPLLTIAKELGIAPSTLHEWKSHYSSSPVRRNAANKKTITEQDVEFIKAKREVERLKKENEILKKAAAYFAKAHV